MTRRDARLDREPDLIRISAYDLNGDGCRRGAAPGGIAGVGEQVGNEGREPARSLQEWYRTVAILHAGTMDVHDQRPSIGVYPDVTFAILELLFASSQPNDPRLSVDLTLWIEARTCSGVGEARKHSAIVAMTERWGSAVPS
jgi:hypothetical protein